MPSEAAIRWQPSKEGFCARVSFFYLLVLFFKTETLAEVFANF